LLDSSSFEPYASTTNESVDTNPRDYLVDPNVEGSGDGWDENLRSVNFSAAIYDQQYIGYYTFKLHVRDDAQKESADYAYVKFLAFTPSFEKDILLIDDTDNNLGGKGVGNPESDDVIEFYKALIGEQGDDVSFDVVDFGNEGTADPYEPITLDKIARYRLVIITSDDRTNNAGIDQNKYKSTLASYMDIGGKVWTIGAVTFISKPFFKDDYSAPNRHILGDASGELIAATDTLLADYFGLKTITYGEDYEKYSGRFQEARVNFGNYDFVGTGTYEHCEDDLQPMIVDSAITNSVWNKQSVQLDDGTYKKSWVLKENGAILPHITTIEPLEAEVCLSYTSIYDLPKVADSDTLVYNPLRNDFQHNLYKPFRSYAYLDTNDVEHWVPSTETPYVLRKEGAVAARFVGNGNVFRSAIFTLPLYFMDNTVKEGELVGPVSKNFSEMINWFEINFNPVTGEYE